MSATSVVVMSMTPEMQAGIDQLFHRAAADAGGVEDEAFPVGFERRRDLLHAGRGDAEHGQADGGQPCGATRRVRLFRVARAAP